MVWHGHSSLVPKLHTQVAVNSMLSDLIFHGRLIAIGGSEDRMHYLEVLTRVVQEIGKADYNVVMIPTASEEPEQRDKEYQQVFAKLGAAARSTFCWHQYRRNGFFRHHDL